MAEARTSKSDQQPDDEAVQATSAQYAGAAPPAPSEVGGEATNPVDLGTDLDKLPPVPGAGQFMEAKDATEPTAAAPEAPKKG